MNRLRTIVTCLVTLGTCGTAFPYYYDTGIITCVQPDSVEFRGREWGDELSSNGRTEDGYAFVWNRTDGYYYYAKLDSLGEFTSSGYKVGVDNPVANGIVKGLERSSERKAAIRASREQFLADSTWTDSTGTAAGKVTAAQVAPPPTITIGIILVEFDDVHPNVA